MIRVKNITKTFGKLLVLDNLSLNLEIGKVNVILGPSGCGKTSLMNILLGLDLDYRGDYFSEDIDIIAPVFQEDRLIKWKSVNENLKFVLEKDKDSINSQNIDEILRILKIEDCKNKLITQLSGGQKQRVSIARAFVYNSKAVLLDEPFKSLDIALKFGIIKDINKLLEKENRTIILVTHNIDEALLIADNVFILTNKPTKLLKEIKINLEKKSRNINSSKIIEIEREILNYLL